MGMFEAEEPSQAPGKVGKLDDDAGFSLGWARKSRQPGHLVVGVVLGRLTGQDKAFSAEAM